MRYHSGVDQRRLNRGVGAQRRHHRQPAVLVREGDRFVERGHRFTVRTPGLTNGLRNTYRLVGTVSTFTVRAERCCAGHHALHSVPQIVVIGSPEERMQIGDRLLREELLDDRGDDGRRRVRGRTTAFWV